MTNDFNTGYLVGMQRGRMIEQEYISIIGSEKRFLERNYYRVLDQKDELEELIKDMWRMILCPCGHEKKCDMCIHNVVKDDPSFAQCEVFNRIKKLGIEVK